MSRDIKFRMWDSRSKDMYRQDELNFNVKYINDNKDVFILMQYTRLTDKNGKEIYEGDVLNMDNSSEFDWFQLGHIKKQIICRDISNNHLIQSDGFSLYKCHEYCEVIGDIHRNPELIKEK